MNFLVKRIHQSSIFLWFVIGIILGIVLSVVFRIIVFDSVIWLILVSFLFLYAIFQPFRFFAIVLFFSGIIVANYRVSFGLRNIKTIENYINETVEITGQVSGDPNLSDSYTAMKIIYDHTPIYVQVYVPKSSEVKRGDFLTLKGELSEGFGIYSASMFRPELLKISRSSSNLLLDLRDTFSKNVQESLAPEESSLGLAYLLGLKNGLSGEIIEILSIVGLTHIVVASGTHLSIIIEFIRKTFGKISRFAGLFFSILFILIFAELVGWTASITRAAIVSILTISMWYIGKNFSHVRIILISMCLTLLIDPMNLTNLGWLLSFGSFSGILILAPTMTKFFYGKKEPKMFSKILLASVSATLMTAPILLYYFGSISLISILANLLILPTIPFAMGFTFLTGLTGFLPSLGIFKLLSAIIVKITTVILDYHLLVMRFFGERTIFLIKIEPGKPAVFLMYFLIFLPIILLQIKKRKAQARAPKRIPLYLN